jgi:hypothetical protein
MRDKLSPDDTAKGGVVETVSKDIADSVGLDNLAGRRAEFRREFNDAALGAFSIAL